MAKKSSKKPAKKAPARKAAAKAARPSKPTSAKAKTTKPKSGQPTTGKAAGKAAGMEPRRITTGAGPGPEEVGRSLVSMFNAGQFAEIEDRWWSPAIESVEGMGMSWSGRAAVDAKNTAWMGQNEILGCSAEGPYVGATGFSVKFRMETREKATGRQVRMEEVGVYTVRNGKIVREEFMYGAAQGVSDAGQAKA
jgi:hypothetical protein